MIFSRSTETWVTVNEEISLNNPCVFLGFFEITSNTLLQPFILPIFSIADSDSGINPKLQWPGH